MSVERDLVPRPWPFPSTDPRVVDDTGPNRDRMQYPTPNTDEHYADPDRDEESDE
jgi:hypothetical protein